MKILLQDPQTKLFLKRLDEWTADPDEALEFESLTRALQLSRTGRVNNARILLHFDQPPLQIPLSAAAAEHLRDLPSEHLKNSVFIKEAARFAGTGRSEQHFWGAPLEAA